MHSLMSLHYNEFTGEMWNQYKVLSKFIQSTGFILIQVLSSLDCFLFSNFRITILKILI